MHLTQKLQGTKRWCTAALLFCMAGMALAATPSEVRKQAEASRIVTGTIDLDRDGAVIAHAFKDAEGLGDPVKQWLSSRIEQWRFEPVVIDGKPRLAQTNMRLRLVAQTLPDKNTALRISSVSFEPDHTSDSDKGKDPRSKNKLTPPRFPEEAMHMGVAGTVYLVLRFGRDGKVADAAAEQVNLRVVGSSRDMELFRKMLAAASLKAARHWQFVPPSVGEEADNEFWRVRVPVDFAVNDNRQPKDTEWTSYIPGPQAIIPWLNYDDLLPPDALAAGGVYPIRKDGLRLKTSLN